MVVDYKQSKIYKIEPINADETDKCYIGSTAQRYLSTRYGEHVSNFRRWLKDSKVKKMSSCEIFLEESPEFCHIMLLEQYPCDNKDQLRAREAYWIKNTECINKLIPGRTKKEYYADNKKEIIQKQKDRYKLNALQKAEYHKQYRLKNKKKISDHKSEQVKCECGEWSTRSHLKRHQRTATHQNNVK